VTRTSLETTDIFIGAFLLSNGANLCGIRIKDRVRRIAAFCIEGEGLDRLDEEYRAGRALVNPARLRDSLNFLRDVLFEFREGDARYDRKGHNRANKADR
jgi:hypothetical protein